VAKLWEQTVSGDAINVLSKCLQEKEVIRSAGRPTAAPPINLDSQRNSAGSAESGRRILQRSPIRPLEALLL